jgi:hypothetical protein
VSDIKFAILSGFVSAAGFTGSGGRLQGGWLCRNPQSMKGGGGVLRLLKVLALGITMSACASNNYEVSEEVRKAEWEAKNVYPQAFRAEILAYLRTYLNDPSGVKEAAVSEPVLKPMGLGNRYVSCLRYRAKTSGDSGSVKDHLVVFVQGKLDAFKEGKEQCVGATYVPFPELEALTR